MPLIFGTQLCLVDICQDCSSCSPVAKNGPALGLHSLHIGLDKSGYQVNSFLISK